MWLSGFLNKKCRKSLTGPLKSCPSPGKPAKEPRLPLSPTTRTSTRLVPVLAHAGSRVQNVVNELGGENIDIVQYEEDPSDYIANALNPAEVIAVQFEDEDDEKKAFVIVPDYQLSLAIGKKGQNVRLAARLTGYKIDIRPESEVEFVDESEVEDETEVAEDQDLQQTAVEEADDQAEAEATEADENAEDLDLDDEE